MINAKVKVISSYTSMVDRELNEFLITIDVRQIIKFEMTAKGESQVVCLIMYLELDDIRDSKIESILDKKQI